MVVQRAVVVVAQVSTHACSLMSRRRRERARRSLVRGFNPRLLVDEQATSRRTLYAVIDAVSTHAC